MLKKSMCGIWLIFPKWDIIGRYLAGWQGAPWVCMPLIRTLQGFPMSHFCPWEISIGWGNYRACPAFTPCVYWNYLKTWGKNRYIYIYIYMLICICICMYTCVDIYVYLLVGVCICECVFCVCVCLCLFVGLLVSIYVSQHRCLWKVNEISVCVFLFRLLPLGITIWVVS